MLEQIYGEFMVKKSDTETCFSLSTSVFLVSIMPHKFHLSTTDAIHIINYQRDYIT